MVIRSSGQVLVNLDTAPKVYLISPFNNQTGGIAYHFESYTSLFGIVEERINISYVIASNFSGYRTTMAMKALSVSSKLIYEMCRIS